MTDLPEWHLYVPTQDTYLLDPWTGEHKTGGDNYHWFELSWEEWHYRQEDGCEFPIYPSFNDL